MGYDKMAPNKGFSGGTKHAAESHGEGMGLSGKQHVTDNAMVKDWGTMAYSAKQDGDGSMQYQSEKKAIAASDAKKLMRTAKKNVE